MITDEERLERTVSIHTNDSNTPVNTSKMQRRSSHASGVISVSVGIGTTGVQATGSNVIADNISFVVSNAMLKAADKSTVGGSSTGSSNMKGQRGAVSSHSKLHDSGISNTTLNNITAEKHMMENLNLWKSYLCI
jgi:hypothetical protein